MTKVSEKKGQREWENETRASAKMSEIKWENKTKQVDEDQPKDKPSCRPPKSIDEGCGNTQRTTMISKSLPQSTQTHWEFNRESCREVDQSSPTNKITTHWDAVYQDTHWQVHQDYNQDSTDDAYQEQP